MSTNLMNATIDAYVRARIEPLINLRPRFDQKLLSLEQVHGPCPASLRKALWEACETAQLLGVRGDLLLCSKARRELQEWKSRGKE